VQPQKSDMSGNSSLDHETFQQLLASAFAVQEGQIHTQSPFPVMEVHRLVATGKLDLDGAMQQIVDSARNVANARGVVIGLLQGDQLIYRAGSGSAVSYLGRQVTASLTVSADAKASGEILRVEDAQTDRRIEAAICRQFGAQSLLILPIYRAHALAGVLQILFSEAHVYQDREVRTYQWMARQIEVAMLHAAQLEQKKNLTAELPATRPSVAEITSQGEKFVDDPESLPALPVQYPVHQGRRTTLAIARELPAFKQPVLLAKKILQRAEDVVRHWNRGNWAVAAVTVVVLVSWIAYSGRRQVSPLRSSAPPKSTATEQQARFQPSSATPAKATSTVPPALVPVSIPAKEEKPARATLRRVRVGENETDYIGEDVTVRHFTYKSAPQRRRVRESRVTYIGEDVTVRYFTPKPAVAPIADERRVE
jgi:GAF domain